ncbi:MAG: ribonuclease H [bacterium]|nr:ribonuclease H [bacterium]
MEENYHAALEKAKTGEVREGDFEEGKCDLAGCEKAEDSSQKRVIFTDGSASPNPGPGGFALIENGAPIALGAENPSTNIRMEGLALKKALEILGEEEAEIQTDSEFWVNVLTKWAPDWQKNGWKKKNGEIKNLDIVQPLFELYQKSNATLKWLKGHAGHEWNELADEWANRAREGEKL